MTVLLAALLLLAEGQPATNAPTEAVRIELERLEQVWNDAHRNGDADALAQLWADDLVVTVPAMPPLQRAEALEFARSGRMRFDRYESLDLSIRVYGEVAVVSGRLRRTRTAAGRVADDDWRFTKVYVRTGDTWRVIAYHASETGP